MTDKIHHISPRQYWGITENGVECYRGTFNECWQELTDTYGDKTLAELVKMNTRIQRIK